MKLGCRHERVRFVAATATWPVGDWSDGYGNGTTGVHAICEDCGWGTSGDLVAAVAPMPQKPGRTIRALNDPPEPRPILLLKRARPAPTATPSDGRVIDDGPPGAVYVITAVTVLWVIGVLLGFLILRSAR